MNESSIYNEDIEYDNKNEPKEETKENNFKNKHLKNEKIRINYSPSKRIKIFDSVGDGIVYKN